MPQQSGRGYKPYERNGMAEQAADRTRELAEEALDSEHDKAYVVPIDPGEGA